MIQAGDFKCPCDACKALGDKANGIKGELAYILNNMEATTGVKLGDRSFKLTISSGYRCPQHNAAIGGAPDSQHCVGMAADVATADSRTRYQIVACAVALGARFIEICPGHVHLDLRSGAYRMIQGKDA